jgi:pyochelin synthetase
VTAAELLLELQSAGVRIWEEEGRLRYRAPRGVLTESHLALLRANRETVLESLRGGRVPAVAVARPEVAHEPFPLTDVQSAYLLGRRDVFAYGGVACQGYGELAFPELDPCRLEAAWNDLMRRHAMLRAVIDADGSQRVLAEVPEYRVAVVDVAGDGAAAEAAARAEMDHRVRQPDRWPLFELRVTRSERRALLHFAIDFLVADFVSIQVLLDELRQRYVHPEAPLPPLEIGFRDYLLAERRLRSGAAHEADREHWWARLDGLPPAPELPVLPTAAQAPPRFTRWETALDAGRWRAVREQAGRAGITPSGAVLAAYAEVIGRWSRSPRFTLDVTLLNRLPLHPQVDRLVGDFTTIELLAVDADPATPFAARARAVQGQLWQDLDHRLCTGVEVIREIARRHGPGAALFPVVFTSTVGVGEEGGAPEWGELVGGISQTPQVWIDCQVMERGGGLSVNWDVRDGVFPDGLVDGAFGAFAELLARLAEPAAWAATCPVPLPAAQAERRRQANDTAAPLPEGLLQDGVLAQARRTPHLPAVIAPDRELTFAELAGLAGGVAARLAAAGCRPGERVAVVMDKGWEQVAGTLGTLLAGCAYVPVDTAQPAARRDRILAGAGIRHALTQSWLLEADWPAGVAPLAVGGVQPAEVPPSPAAPDDLAYVIYTSGSTGVPKGVMITHRAALNTVEDVNRRFGVRVGERVLGLSSLGFDLSVYDVFGVLAAGGGVVLPDAARRGDPSHWAELVAEHGVTIWNSVPAQLQMLHDYLAAEPELELPSLRLAMLSGDWIPVSLPDQARRRLPGLEVVSLGGATEAAIWSIFHRIGAVPAEWRSIPYGRPLANQRFHVLDAGLRPSPEWTPGELYIAGDGLALGYLGDEAQTAERFLVHPDTGERLYRTGDWGRYLPDGAIEFLGREDLQVKIRGHRIELAEVEAALLAHSGVGAAVAVVDGDRPLERRLAAFVEPAVVEPGPPPALEALAAAAAAAGRERTAGVDADAYLAYTRGLDEVALLAMLGALAELGLFATPAGHTLDEVLAAGRVAPAHHRLVRRWLASLTAHGLLGHEGGVYSLARPVTADDAADGWRRLEALAAAAGDGGRLLEYFRASAAELPALLRGEQDPVRLLFPAGGLDVSDALHRDSLVSAWTSRVVAAVVCGLLPAGRPARVLEVGGGVGGSSSGAIDGLAGRDAEYLFTDLSQFFLNAAAERFGDRPWVRFGVLDLDADPRAQGLQPNAFDLVFAGDVLHATRDLDRALERLRELLAPGGWLVFAEMTRDHAQIMTSLELMIRLDESGDFGDERRGRDQTFLSRGAWLDAVVRAGGEVGLVLPEAGDLMADIGMHVFAARFKASRAPIDPAGLTAHLGGLLPEYMVPAHLEVVDALPLTDNGKVDRRTLRSWLGARTDPAGGAGAEPLGDLERRLAAAWAEVLAVGSVGRDRDFFSLGGDSLLAAQLAGRLRESVPEAAAVFFDDLLRRILEGPTVAGLAASLAEPEAPAAAAEPAEGSPLVVLDERGEGTPVVLVGEGLGDLAAVLAGPAPLYALAPGPLDGEIGLRRAAAACAGALLDQGCARVHLVGHGAGTVLACEVAGSLADSGGEVESLTVIGGPLDGHEPDAYAGDVTVLRPAGEDGAALADLWTRVCLGDLRVVDVPGDAATCLRPPHVAALAEAVAAGGRELQGTP